jgi:hypothetical protein
MAYYYDPATDSYITVTPENPAPPDTQVWGTPEQPFQDQNVEQAEQTRQEIIQQQEVPVIPPPSALPIPEPEGLTEAQKEGIKAVEAGVKPNLDIQGSPQTQLQISKGTPIPQIVTVTQPTVVIPPTNGELEYTPVTPNGLNFDTLIGGTDLSRFKNLDQDTLDLIYALQNIVDKKLNA